VSVSCFLDGDTSSVSSGFVTDITSKMLHEKTGQVLDRARQGERFRIIRDGQPDAFLVPASETIDPEWPEIMAEVWKAGKSASGKRPNPILKERRARKYGSSVR
jgi:prevent-host-death family protein